MLEELLKSVEISLFTHEFHLAGSHDALILIGKFCLLLHERNVLLAEGLLLKVHLGEILLSEFLFDIRSVRAFLDRRVICQHIRHYSRHGLVDPLVLLIVELILGIKGVPDADDGKQCGEFFALLFRLHKDVIHFFTGGSIFYHLGGFL